MSTRRVFIKGVAGGLVIAGGGSLLPRLAAAAQRAHPGPEMLPAGTLEGATLEALPGKAPLIRLTYRPPNYETPVAYFNEMFTPNEAFFVRYHLADIPEVNAETWRLKVGGDAVERPLELGLEDLKKGFEQVEVAAVCMCSGNRRGLSDPHVPGIQWGYGAMGNARWKGVRVREILAKAGLKATAVEVACDGADQGVIKKTPDFVKSVPAWKAMDENTLVAYEMNGAPLPHWNGYPARLVVPGWTAVYWVKQITTLAAVSQPLAGFWMNPAYRIPKGKFPVIDRFVSQETEANTPITEMVVSSLITNIVNGQRFPAGAPVTVKGIAWDGGYGIRAVEVSTDGGRTWRPAELGQDHGRFSWRQFGHTFQPEKGSHTIMAKATNRQGASQAYELIFNPAGYHNNVVQKLDIHVG